MCYEALDRGEHRSPSPKLTRMGGLLYVASRYRKAMCGVPRTSWRTR